jgi:hypothetical protein
MEERIKELEKGMIYLRKVNLMLYAQIKTLKELAALEESGEKGSIPDSRKYIEDLCSQCEKNFLEDTSAENVDVLKLMREEKLFLLQ